MRIACLAIGLFSFALVTAARAEDIPPGLPAPQAVAARPVQIQAVHPLAPGRASVVAAWPGEIDVMRGRRSAWRAPYQRIYAPNYGLTHGWGVPGGRWDPSLPRD